jgi:hypothetical protein
MNVEILWKNSTQNINFIYIYLRIFQKLKLSRFVPSRPERIESRPVPSRHILILFNPVPSRPEKSRPVPRNPVPRDPVPFYPCNNGLISFHFIYIIEYDKHYVIIIKYWISLDLKYYQCTKFNRNLSTYTEKKEWYPNIRFYPSAVSLKNEKINRNYTKGSNNPYLVETLFKSCVGQKMIFLIWINLKIKDFIWMILNILKMIRENNTSIKRSYLASQYSNEFV